MKSESTDERRPALSVGMPVYNGERWLEAAARSILGQTFGDLELIISDNASSDGTRALAERLAAEDPRVRYARNAENIGVANNYNRVFGLARAAYFKWASVSDHCDPTMLEKCVRVLQGRADAVLCYPRTWLVGPDGALRAYEHDMEFAETRPCKRFERLLRTTRLNNMLNGVIRSDALRRAKPQGAYLASDMPLMAELVLQGKFLLVPEPLFYRRAEILLSDKERLRGHYAERLKYFDPQNRNALLFQQWKQLFGYFEAARLAAIPPAERRCVYRHVLRAVIWSRGELWSDVWMAAGTSFRRGRAARVGP